MAKTRTFSVNTATYTAVTVQTVCKRVIVYEDKNAATTDYKLSGSGADSDAVTRPAGLSKEFIAGDWWFPNDVPGYIKAVSGAVTFAQEEEGQ